MPIDRGGRARIRYRADRFLSTGAGRQLLVLLAIVLLIVFLDVGVASILALEAPGDNFGDMFWFYFTRVIDTGTMAGDQGAVLRLLSTFNTMSGIVVAGLLISSLASSF